MSRVEPESDGLPARLPAGQPKGQAVREIIEALVASLGPGAPLPSERRLADHYGLAPMTVRTEVDRLVAEASRTECTGAAASWPSRAWPRRACSARSARTCVRAG